MPVDNWPSTLPSCLVLGSHSEGLSDGRLRSQMDMGPEKVRRRSSAMPRPLQGTLWLNRSQLTTLRTFVDVTLMGGTLPFIIKKQEGNGRHLARFGTSLPSWQRVVSNKYSVDISIEILSDLGPA